jgi:hypothetical protein
MKKRPMDRRSHDRYVGNIRTQLEIAKEVLLRLEMARDRRVLLDQEESLRKKVKLKSLGLASLQRSIGRQESRLFWLKEGDAPTKFFHVQANACRRKNFIRSLMNNGSLVTQEEDKADLAFQFYCRDPRCSIYEISCN